jgi:hypothetical protein
LRSIQNTTKSACSDIPVKAREFQRFQHEDRKNHHRDRKQDKDTLSGRPPLRVARPCNLVKLPQIVAGQAIC